MNSSWRKHLDSLQASFSEGGSYFTSARDDIRHAANGAVIVDLSHLSLISIRGADSTEFLQGQLTCDAQKIKDGSSSLCAYCSPKGRMLGLGHLVYFDNSYLLLVPTEIAASLIARLQMFVLRANVTVSDAKDANDVSDSSDEICVVGLAGEAAIEIATERFPGLDQGQQQGLVLAPITTAQSRFLVYGTVDKLMGLWRSLSPPLEPVGSSAWQWLDIRDGLPSVTLGIQDRFVPQMANLDLLSGISFEKGCYVGQEIVARMHYLGRLKQRMVRLRLEAEEPPIPGTQIYSPAHGAQSAGSVISASLSPEQGIDLLAIVQLKALDESDLHLGEPTGPDLQPQALPYELPA